MNQQKLVEVSNVNKTECNEAKSVSFLIIKTNELCFVSTLN